MSGRDLARWFREKRPDVKVLSSSGFADIVQDEAVAGPDLKLLRKPYSRRSSLAQCAKRPDHNLSQRLQWPRESHLAVMSFSLMDWASRRR
jgi:hypothetical protein